MLAVSALVLVPPDHKVAAAPRSEHVAIELQSVVMDLDASAVITRPALPSGALQTRAAADATAGGTTNTVSDAIHLGVSLFLFPALWLMSPIVLVAGLTCVLSLNCEPNDPRRSLIKGYFSLIDPAMRFLAPLLGFDWHEPATATSSTATVRPVGTKPTAGRTTGASKRPQTKPDVLPANAARIHQKPKAPAALRKTTSAGHAKAGSARRH